MFISDVIFQIRKSYEGRLGDGKEGESLKGDAERLEEWGRQLFPRPARSLAPDPPSLLSSFE